MEHTSSAWASPTMFAHAYLTLLQFIDGRKWGSVKNQAFAYLAQRQLADPEAMTKGVGFTHRDLAAATGRSEGRCYEVLRELVEDRVFELVRKGAGSRPGEYRINPDVDRWRNVPLTVPVEVACWRLDALGYGRARYLTRIMGPMPEMSPAVRPPARESFVALLAAAQQENQVALLAALRASDPALAVREILEISGTDSATPDGSLRDGGSDLVSRVLGASPTPSNGGVAPLTPGSLRSPLKDGGGGAAHPGTGALLAAIQVRTGEPVGPPLQRRIEALVAGGSNPEQLRAWMAKAPPKFRPPLIVSWLEEVVAGGGEGIAAAEDRELTERLVANLRQQVHTMVQLDELDEALERLHQIEDVDPEAAAELVGELPQLGRNGARA